MGLALNLYLNLDVIVDSSSTNAAPLNCRLTYADQNTSTEDIPLDPDANLITRSALYVLRCHNQRAFPVGTSVHVRNDVPLGRGLGSSASAVVAGVTLGNEVWRLGLSKDRLLDYCLMIGVYFCCYKDILSLNSCREASRQCRSRTVWRVRRYVSQRAEARGPRSQRNPSSRGSSCPSWRHRYRLQAARSTRGDWPLPKVSLGPGDQGHCCDPRLSGTYRQSKGGSS